MGIISTAPDVTHSTRPLCTPYKFYLEPFRPMHRKAAAPRAYLGGTPRGY